MDIDLLQTEQVRQKIMNRIESRRWWVIFSYKPQTADLLIEIEDRFYSGAANADFELAVIPPATLHPLQPITAVALFHKRRMCADRLAGLLGKVGYEVEADHLQGGDVLFPGDVEVGGAMVRMVYGWLQRPELN